MAKTRRCTFRGEEADFERWEAAAAAMRYHEFGDFVRRALDDASAGIVEHAPVSVRAAAGKTQAKPDPKKKARQK